MPEPAWERRFVLGLQATAQRSPAIEWYVGALTADHAAEVATP